MNTRHPTLLLTFALAFAVPGCASFNPVDENGRADGGSVPDMAAGQASSPVLCREDIPQCADVPTPNGTSSPTGTGWMWADSAALQRAPALCRPVSYVPTDKGAGQGCAGKRYELRRQRPACSAPGSVRGPINDVVACSDDPGRIKVLYVALQAILEGTNNTAHDLDGL